MKRNVSLPFCANAAILWKEYLDSLANYFRKSLRPLAKVSSHINSIKNYGDINIDKMDRITISDGHPEVIGKKIFIIFTNHQPDKKADNKIRFTFLMGIDYEENYRHKEVAQLHFDAKILGRSELIEQLELFIISGKPPDPDYFLKNKLAHNTSPQKA